MIDQIETLEARVAPLSKEEAALLKTLFMAQEHESVSPAAFFLLELLIAEAHQRSEIENDIEAVRAQMREHFQMIGELSAAYAEKISRKKIEEAKDMYEAGCHLSYQVTEMKTTIRQLKERLNLFTTGREKVMSWAIQDDFIPWNSEVQQLMMRSFIGSALAKMAPGKFFNEEQEFDPLSVVHAVALQMRAAAQFQRHYKPSEIQVQLQENEVQVEKRDRQHNQSQAQGQAFSRSRITEPEADFTLPNDQVAHSIPLNLKAPEEYNDDLPFPPIPSQVFDEVAIIKEQRTSSSQVEVQAEESFDLEKKKKYIDNMKRAVVSVSFEIGSLTANYQADHPLVDLSLEEGIDEKLINVICAEPIEKTKQATGRKGMNCKSIYISRIGLEGKKPGEPSKVWCKADVIAFMVLLRVMEHGISVNADCVEAIQDVKRLIRGEDIDPTWEKRETQFPKAFYPVPPVSWH